MWRQRGWLMAVIGIMAACSSQSDSPTSAVNATGDSGAGGGATGAAGETVTTRNFPQEELAKTTNAIKISGTIAVPGYEHGRIQIDVLPPQQVSDGQGPITTAHIEKPGPYELLIPAGTKQVKLTAILDFNSDGPDAADAIADYPDNPLSIEKKTSGIDFTIDKTNVKAPPPPETVQRMGGSKPPWEKEGEEAAAPATQEKADASSESEPVGKPVPAPPGSKEGPVEGSIPGK